jgi:hypothetical protein
MADQPEIISVKSALGDNRVALHERHPDHPENADGEREVFIYGDKAFEVARTQAVDEHIARKDLVEVGGSRRTTRAQRRDEADADERARAEQAAAEKQAQAERDAAAKAK